MAVKVPNCEAANCALGKGEVLWEVYSVLLGYNPGGIFYIS